MSGGGAENGSSRSKLTTCVLFHHFVVTFLSFLTAADRDWRLCKKPCGAPNEASAADQHFFFLSPCDLSVCPSSFSCRFCLPESSHLSRISSLSLWALRLHRLLIFGVKYCATVCSSESSLHSGSIYDDRFTPALFSIFVRRMKATPVVCEAVHCQK